MFETKEEAMRREYAIKHMTRKEKEELWLQKEVIEFLRCASSTFFTAKRYEKLRAKTIKDGSRRKYKKTDVLAFVEYLQKSV